MKTNDVRDKFINYFARHDHQKVASSSLIPQDDPTLLFTNAGMNQFKNVFLGLEHRNYKRAVSAQKCVRAGGKHNDLENVGFTARHHTFFEMLGNFSFGDYFKNEAIRMAWEFVTKELGLPKDRLYVSVFEKDEEAATLWHKQEGIPKERIYRFGEKDNFWRMGNTGPCGPCSEIFFDLGAEVGGSAKDNVMGGDGDRFMEIWNLVFMQFNENEKGVQIPLPNPSIDTGMGLERIAAVMQEELSNYHTDTFRPILDKLGKMCRGQYIYDTRRLKGNELKKIEKDNVAYRVLADHARATAFLIADGVLPSNEGRGYVLRRIMRRAIRYGRKLSLEASLLPTATEELIALMKGSYPELSQQKQVILNTVREEERRFLKTLDQGTEILQAEFQRLEKKSQQIVSGEFAFKLYDTYGFPIDLTRIMASEQNFKVNEEEFEKQFEKAREKAKASWKGAGLSTDAAHLIKISQELARTSGPTQFTGYDRLTENAKVLLLSNGQKRVSELTCDQTGYLAADKTCFYAEGGGQIGDNGKIQSAHGQAEVLSCSKHNDIHIHHIKVTDGFLKEGDLCAFEVNRTARQATANNHSATHLLHAALRKVLGAHVTQAGSLVEPERLRFDFTHNQPVSDEELQQIENLVNYEIAGSEPVQSDTMEQKSALAAGALALFGEKYGEKVRVIKMGDFSFELCGGTHVENTAFIRLFKIVSESGVSAGVRRIEAITGQRAVEYALKNSRDNQSSRQLVGARGNWETYLDESENVVAAWIESQKAHNKELQRQVQSMKSGQIDTEKLVQAAKTFKYKNLTGKLIFADLAVDDRQVLSEISDQLKNKVESGVIVVVGQGSASHPIIVSVTKNLIGTYKAGDILKTIAEKMGGKGGGRPDFAQGAGKDRSQLAAAFAKVEEMF